MLVLDYNTVINHTSNDVERSKAAISSIGKKPSLFSVLLTSIFGDAEKRVTKTFEYQLFMSGWLLADIQKNYAALADKDWSNMIALLNKGIKQNIEVQSKIESSLQETTTNTQLELLLKEVEETITNFYSCIRLFKKATKKTQHDHPSDVAINAASVSANTINTLYAR